MKEDTTGLVEANITIAGRALTFQQSMAVRVAIGHMRHRLDDVKFRRGLGAQLSANYDQHLGVVEARIIEAIAAERAGESGSNR